MDFYKEWKSMNGDSERYKNMKDLRDSLNKMFETLGVEIENIEIRNPSKLQMFLEKLLDDEDFYEYFKILSAQTKPATEKIKDLQLEQWNNRENEKYYEKIEQELENEKEKSKALAAELEICRKNEKSEELFSIIRDVIDMKDSLLFNRKWVQDHDPENTEALKLLANHLSILENILEKAGVRMIEEQGEFQSEKHVVVMTAETEDVMLNGQIAEVIRSGYIYKNEVLRCAEVTLYMIKEESENLYLED